MASDPTRDLPAGDPDPDLFREACEVAASLLPTISSPGDDYADVFTQQIARQAVEGRLTLRSGRQLPISLVAKARSSDGAAFRRLGERAAFAATNGLAAEGLRACARQVAERTVACQSVTPEHASAPVPAKVREEFTAFVRETAETCLSVLDGCRQVTVRTTAIRKRSWLCNSLEHVSESTSRRTELHVEVETEDAILRETWVDWDTNRAPSITPADVALAFRRRAARHAMPASPCPDQAAVLLPPGWGGTWMHEAVGHLLEADTALSGDSALYDRFGIRVAGEMLTIVDDGRLQPSRVERSHDDEGVATNTTPLIEQGIVVGLMTDRTTGPKTDHGLTGNGRRAHFGVPPRPRMTNLLLQSGPSTREDLVANFETLIVVDRISHAWFDLSDYLLHLDISEAALVHNGNVLGRLDHVIASAEPLRLLGDVAGIASDFAVDLNRGYCLKEGAALPVTIGQPSVLVKSMQIRPAGG